MARVARERCIIQHLQSRKCKFSSAIACAHALGEKRECLKVGDRQLPPRDCRTGLRPSQEGFSLVFLLSANVFHRYRCQPCSNDFVTK